MVKRNYLEQMRHISTFFETERFNNLVRIISKNLPISQESLLYEQRKIEGLSHDDFREVISTVLEKFPNHNERTILPSLKDAVFGYFYVDYN